MIIVLIEHDRGDVSKASYEALTFARDLDDQLAAVVIGDDVEEIAEELNEYGVTDAYIFDDGDLEEYAPAAWGRCIAQLVENESPAAVLATGTDRGNEVMAHAGAILGLPMCANVLEGDFDDDYSVTRVRWGGSLLEEATISGDTKLMTLAPLHVEASTVDNDEDVEIHEQDVELEDNDLRVQVSSREEPEQAGVSLTDARIVVSGGRGVGSAEGFDKLDALAKAVEGAVGCSRAVTNNGWRPHADQVGQTGNRVAPDLYIANGISGASQHMAGCAASKHLLVINTDPEAPILAKADYAIIGDLHEVLPAITAEVKKLKSKKR
ncbi:MAG: electron transfer flavoprotein subunit alpha/FixB family protein [Candidatus Promineifilaceae bacterium]